MNSSELLTNYRKTGSEAAFASLLRRYTNLVYSVAKRRLSDQSLAEEVTQTVFTRLAKSPPPLQHEGELVSWLHRTTTHVAIDAWRSETRRRNREQHAAAMQTLTADDSRIWKEMTPHLDEALNQLADEDRKAVLLRFFDRKPMREIGDVLGVSEDAAKMRVSRAVDRLRRQLSARGVTCTVLGLATLLGQRAVEAAPAHLLTRLVALNLAVPAGIIAGGMTGWMLHLAKSRAALGTAGVLALVVVVAIFLNRPGSGKLPLVVADQNTVPAQAVESGPRPRFSAVESSGATATEPNERARFILRVIDQETGKGLAGAQVRAAYFYAGGVGERHEFESDADGHAAVPYPNIPGRNAGLNVFVGLPGYVPKSIGFGRLAEPAPDYVLELAPALAVGGTVVDENGWPVAGVTLEAQDSEEYKEGVPNTDFQTTKVTTDVAGRWWFPYVPKGYASVNFYLSCSDYAVTHVAVSVGEPDSVDATLVIESGFTVVGRVVDSSGQPMAGTNVKERHEFGFQKRSTQTDESGYYEMRGLGIPHPKTVDLSNPLKPVPSIRPPEQKIDLVVQAPGMAAQLQSVTLSAPTNTVNFVLASGSLFRGRVVDEDGNPISGAVVRTDSRFDPYIPNSFEWLSHTDAHGRFEWNSAPAEETCFWFEADGYEEIRGRPMLTDGTDHEIKLARKSASTMTGR